MSKSIGIKLADGAFYPILEEGKAAQVNMDLTTVKDNQEIVHIDLYRSESGTLEDAEYVDTLQIENIKPHPNGEPNLRLEISLNEENTLDAKVSDLESGKQSNITVSLVSRPEAERAAVDADASLQFTEPPVDESLESGLGEDAVQAKSFADDTNDTLDLDNLVFDADKSQIVDAEDAMFDGEPLELPENLSTDDSAESFDQASDDAFDDAGITGTQTGDELSDDFFDNAVNEFLDDTPSKESESQHENFIKKGAENTSDFSIDFDDLPTPDDIDKSNSDFKIDFDETPSSPEQNAKSSSVRNFYDEDFNIDDVKHESSRNDFSDTPQNVLFSDLYDDTDFDQEERTETRREEKKKSRGGIIALICLLCAVVCAAAVLLFLFGIPPRISSRLGIGKEQPAETAAGEEHPPVPPVDQIIFTDKPITIVPIPAPQGQQPDQATQGQEQTPPEPKEPPPPPQEQAQTEQPTAQSPPEPVPEPAPASPPVREPPPPQQKPVETTLTPQPIKYTIKWGDTLWDIAWAYYRNPWRYTYIAQYNGIKNPDKIMAGTVILIPPR